jgi:hypothetical protein
MKNIIIGEPISNRFMAFLGMPIELEAINLQQSELVFRSEKISKLSESAMSELASAKLILNQIKTDFQQKNLF